MALSTGLLTKNHQALGTEHWAPINYTLATWHWAPINYTLGTEHWAPINYTLGTGHLAPINYTLGTELTHDDVLNYDNDNLSVAD